MTTDRFQKLNKNLKFLFDVVITNPNDRKIRENDLFNKHICEYLFLKIFYHEKLYLYGFYLDKKVK